MRDAQDLFVYFATSLGLSASLCLAGCTDGSGAKKQGSTTTGTQTVKGDEGAEDEGKSDDEAGDDGANIPEEIDRLPSCPSGSWCGTADQAKPFARKPGPDQPPVEEKMGCLADLQQDYSRDGKPEYESFPGEAYAYLDEAATTKAREDGAADQCCYTWTIPCPGGRPLLVEGRPRVAMTQAGRAWTPRLDARAVPLPESLRSRVAREWLADALMEHASVAAFARFTLQLMANGAPPELLAGAQQAALDEVEHAQACFAIASRYGVARQPGPIDTAGLDIEPGLIALVESTFLEGCVNETIAALAAGRARRATRDEAIAAALERIEADERRHAALAWKTLEWALARGGAPVADHLRVVLQRTMPDQETLPAADPDATQLAAAGRLDERRAALTVRDAWHEIIEPTARALLDRPTAPLRA